MEKKSIEATTIIWANSKPILNANNGDKIELSSFGIDLNDRKEFNFWTYNIPTTHKIKLISDIYFKMAP